MDTWFYDFWILFLEKCGTRMHAFFASPDSKFMEAYVAVLLNASVHWDGSGRKYSCLQI